MWHGGRQAHSARTKIGGGCKFRIRLVSDFEINFVVLFSAKFSYCRVNGKAGAKLWIWTCTWRDLLRSFCQVSTIEINCR